MEKSLNQVIKDLKSCDGKIIKLINDSDTDLLSVIEIKDKARSLSLPASQYLKSNDQNIKE